MFSSGTSSGAAGTEDYPAVVTMADNIHAQHKLLTSEFGVSRIAAAYGFSMGAGQAYHWAALYPDLVERAIVVCGSARTSLHNRVFLSGLLRTLEAAPEHLGNGRFSAEPVAALRAFGHIYAGWGLSQDFYRARLFETALGCGLTAFLSRVGRVVRLAGREPVRPGHDRQEADISAREPPGRPDSGALLDLRPGAADAGRDHLLPGRRQRGRTGPPAARRARGHPQRLGPPRGQPGGNPGRRGVPDQDGQVVP
jgi:pimeloyl-ACP methyl ester carboxylesterase